MARSASLLELAGKTLDKWCLTTTFNSRFKALAVGLGALVLGALGVPVLVDVWHGMHPVRPWIDSVEVSPTTSDGTWVTVTANAVRTDCTRSIQHLLVQHGDTLAPMLYTMAFNESGPGLMPAFTKFRNVLHIPAGFPPGQYDYYFRSVQTCPPLGLVMGNYTLGPWPVTVGP